MSPIDVLDPYRLSAEQVGAYRRDGFIRLPRMFTGEWLERLRAAVERAVAQEGETDWMGEQNEKQASTASLTYQRIFTQRVDVWRRYPEIAPFATSGYLGNVAATLAGAAMQLWHDQALFKEPDNSGKNKTPWHQDGVYWPHTPLRHQTSIWIALEATTHRNGCLSFLKGSHTSGIHAAVDLADPVDVFDLQPDLRALPAIACPLDAGDCTFHNGLTYHFAGSNRTREVRKGYAVIYMPTTTQFTGAPHPVTDRMELTVNAPFDDRFPLTGRPAAA